MSGSGLVYSSPRTMHVVQSTIAPRLNMARPQGTACHPESPCAGLKSNDHACPLVSSQSLVSTLGDPQSTSSVSTYQHVVPSTQPRCSPSCRGKPYPSLQVKKSPSTVTPKLDMLVLRILHCHDESTGAGPDGPWASRSITRR